MKTAFIFPGQGAQLVGMGQGILNRCPEARHLFEQASEVLGYDLEAVCANGPPERVDATDVAQPALFVCSMAALELLRHEQPDIISTCSITAGLSVGEYTALVFAGVLSFEDGLALVKRRGEAMQAASGATPSGMASILMLDREQVAKICDEASSAGQISMANFLCPGNIVVSGELAARDRAVELADEAGGKTVKLAVAGAFHTSLMKPADEHVAAAAAKAHWHAPRLDVVSNVDAKIHCDPTEFADLLVRQVVSPVLWEDSMRVMLDAGVERFYEIGTGKVLKGLLKRVDRKVPCLTVNDDGIAER